MSETANKGKRPYRRRPKTSPESANALLPMPEAAPVVEAAPVPAPAPAPAMRLTPGELLTLRIAEAEGRAALAEREVSRIRRLYFLALIDPKGTVLAEEKRLEQKERALRDARSRFDGVKMNASRRLGVDLNKCGFDPETGEVVLE